MSWSSEASSRLPELCFRSARQAEWVCRERWGRLWMLDEHTQPQPAEVFEKFPLTTTTDHPPTSAMQSSSSLVSKFGLRIPGVAWLLVGSRDAKSTLRALGGHGDILRIIATRLAELVRSDFVDTDGIFAARVGAVEFPKPTGLSCNMMPIKVGDVESIPVEFRSYVPLLAACSVARGDWFQVAYLTVDERQVQSGSSHRRAGLHVEAPTIYPTSASRFNPQESDRGGVTLAWGKGYCLRRSSTTDDGWTYEEGHLEGGLFVASTVDDSTAVYNCRPKEHAANAFRKARDGDVEHLRPFLPQGVTLKAGDLAWLTDQTPHESLPLDAPSTTRQFFRLVTSRIDVWYADHSTPNPNVPLPPSVTVVHGDKFDPNTQDNLCHRLQEQAL
mmetsp:Transcript_37351/g.119818  ORF Transcript_37351/g.119818 Transcript_37351/m.119818 type:complete len:387 (+) Transcript_37351:77-1237(+)